MGQRGTAVPAPTGWCCPSPPNHGQEGPLAPATATATARAIVPSQADVTGLVTAPLGLGRNGGDITKVKCVPTETAVEKTRVTFFFYNLSSLSCVRISEACPEGLFGARCEEQCDCGDNVSCHHVTGACDCPRGWRGRRCEKGEPAPLRRHGARAPLGTSPAPSAGWEAEKLRF